MKLFITGFVQVFFVAVNTFLISRMLYAGVFVFGFLISFVWSWNVKRVAFGTIKDRLWYSLGAGTGSLAGLAACAWAFARFAK